MKIIYYFFFLSFFVFDYFAFAQYNFRQDGALSISENYRIHPSTVTQSEVFITVHPNNPDILFSSANTVTLNPFFVGEGVYTTTNGGTNWFGSDTCKGGNILFHGGDPGITINKDGRFILTRLGRAPFYGLYSHYSTDNGITWSNSVTISQNENEYKAVLTTDAFSSSTFNGRVYAAWTRFTPPYPIMFTYSDNGAESWITPKQINNPTLRSNGADLTIDQNGKLYACWAGVQDVSPFTEIKIGFATSTDGGITWNSDDNKIDMNGISGVLSDKANIRVNGLPRIGIDTTGGQRNGWLYIVTTQINLAPAGTDPDIILNRSTDGGATWSSGIRVNQDALNNHKIQYFPALHIDHTGAINILYYDDRKTTSDSAGVFLSRSTDGGDTWIDYEVSDHNFMPQPIGGLGAGYQGDNIGLTANGKFIFPAWMDNSSGIYQLWTAPISFTTVNVENQNTIISPKQFSLLQNYPNPFNPSTTISFNLSTKSFTTLRIFDSLGNLVQTLVNEEMNAGKYEKIFDASNLSSGVYIYSIQTKDFTESHGMMLLK